MLDVSSPIIPSDIGIAQGSCVGPLIFIIYMNDNVRCSSETNFLTYANDTTLYVSGNDIGQCISIMNECLSPVYRSLNINKLSLNFSKPNYVIFNRRKHINLNELPSITLKNTALERRETVNFLGVYLGEGLNWMFQINYISKRKAKFPLLLSGPIYV